MVDSSLRGARREQIVQAACESISEFEAGAGAPDKTGQDVHETFAEQLVCRGIDPETARLVWVVEYDVPDREGNGSGELIVLLSTITDPDQARADELAGRKSSWRSGWLRGMRARS